MSHQHSDITIESDLSADPVRLHVTIVFVLVDIRRMCVEDASHKRMTCYLEG